MSHKRRRGQHGTAVVPGSHKRSHRRKHLYLVLDDWDKGYNIYKLDADNFDCDDDRVAGHLPEPPALRLESPVGRVPYTGMSFSAMGTKIFVFMKQRCGLIYDTKTAALAAGAHAPAQMVCGFGVFVAVGEVLYALTYRFFDKDGQHSFEAMSWAPTAPDARQQPTTEGWSWKTLPAPPPSFTSRQRVVSYALHPDGHTIFMTTAYKDTPGAPLGTYSFDTKRSEWRSQGCWALPFIGQGYFDSELDAWVGLCQDGYICSCQVVHPSAGASVRLDWQKTEEKLFYKDTKRHRSASLTYMGTSKFCLIQCLASLEQPEEERSASGDHHVSPVLQVTLFGLKYNHKGELQTTHHQSTRSFIVSRHRCHFRPFGFWM